MTNMLDSEKCLLPLLVFFKVLNSIVDHNELWVEQFLLTDLHQKEKKNK